MTMTIGRVGSDVSLRDPSTWNAQGDRASITGWLSAATQADVNALREQLLGYQDNHFEEVIPVTWTVDSRVDGFYRVLGVQVSEDPDHRVAFTLPYRLELERVPGFAAPQFESVLMGGVRTNGHGIVTGDTFPWHGVPTATSYYSLVPSPAIGFVIDTRVSADGDISVFGTVNNSHYDAKATWYVPAASYYVGAATIEVGTTLRKVVGRQVEAKPYDWRLSNGLLRITPVASTSDIEISCFDGAQWDTAKRFDLGSRLATAFDPFDNWAALTVLRNSPEAAAIRLSTAGSAAADFATAVNVDITLRRGARMAEVAVTCGAAIEAWVRLNTAEAATALTAGIRATSNDAAGNRYVIASPLAFTQDLVNGTLYNTTGATAVPFGIGLEVGGSGATGNETAQELIDQYMAALGERLLVVGR